MTLLFSARAGREARIDAAFADAATVGAVLGDVDVPADIAAWLGRLHALVGVPFGYLVPDEAMLPPESIRFFRLDENWARALLDGAFSLGRNLTAEAASPTTNVDRAAFASVVASARAAAPLRQRSLAEVADPAAAPTQLGSDGDAAPKPWTGFLLRSRVVSEYPGLGVNVYPADGLPGSSNPILLPVRRLDRLGDGADTLLCLVEGDAAQVDVHEAPELLHYGLDDYTPPSTTGAAPTADKELRTFSRDADGKVTFDGTVSVPVGSAFRTRSPRVVSLSALAGLLQAKNTDPSAPLDSAQLGFAMTQGVGKVSFERRTGS